MKILLKHKRLRCERIKNETFFADDYEIVPIGSESAVGFCELRNAPIEALPYTGNVSYTVFEPYRGRGYAKQALSLLCDLAAEAQMSELWITCDSKNTASIAVCKSLGAVFVDEISAEDSEEYRSRGISNIVRFKIFV